jgi:uncharacterized membrane protein
MARLIGVRPTGRTRQVLRGYGLREIGAGAGILTQPQEPGWMWSRVAGDALDLATLGAAWGSPRTDRTRLIAAASAVAGVALADILCSRQLSEQRQAAYAGDTEANTTVRVRKSITVNKPLEEVFRFWSDFQNFPRFMHHLESVTVTYPNRSHWKAIGPAGMTFEWDAEITESVPNQLVAWRSVEGSEVWNTGRVEFRPAPGGQGTEIHVDLRYAPPAGTAGKVVAKLFGREPEQEVDADLRRFRQVIETGEVTRSDASIHTGMHAAQPTEEPVPAPAY